MANQDSSYLAEIHSYLYSALTVYHKMEEPEPHIKIDSPSGELTVEICFTEVDEDGGDKLQSLPVIKCALFSPFEELVLKALREFGPMSFSQLAKRMGKKCDQGFRERCHTLRERQAIIELQSGGYDINK